MTCNVKELQDDSKGPQNFRMVQVKPNWHGSTDLLGYRSAIRKDEYVGTKLVEFLFRAYAYPDTPFFVCLDEMNLAPVEQYFAEFLSAMESLRPADATKPDGAFVSDPISDLSADKDAANLSKLGCATKPAFKWLTEHGLTIPKNLFVVGTVNMDETTNQFSRKVLDRAMTIEMTDANLSDFGKVSEPSFADRIDNSIIEKLIRRPIRVEKLDEDDCREDAPLLAVQKCLEKTPFAIAFRFANEYTLYKRGMEAFDPGKTMKVDPLDHAVLMKVLPRIAGTKESVRTIFGGREDFAVATDAASGNSLLGILSDESLLSNQKMRAILARNESYLTFWP